MTRAGRAGAGDGGGATWDARKRDIEGRTFYEQRIHHPYPGDSWVQDGYWFFVEAVTLWLDDECQLRWDVTLTNGRPATPPTTGRAHATEGRGE
jgi:hypothetical protein